MTGLLFIPANARADFLISPTPLPGHLIIERQRKIAEKELTPELSRKANCEKNKQEYFALVKKLGEKDPQDQGIGTRTARNALKNAIKMYCGQSMHDQPPYIR